MLSGSNWFCPGLIDSCLNSCRLKTSTPQTPNVPSVRASARRNRYKKDTDQIVKQKSEDPINLWKNDMNFRNNKSMTQARKKGMEAAGSLRSWSINCCMISSCNVSVVFYPSSAPPQQYPHVHLNSYAILNSPLSLGIPISSPHQPHSPSSCDSSNPPVSPGLMIPNRLPSPPLPTRSPPSPPPPPPPQTLPNHSWNPFWCSAKETYFCIAKTSFAFFSGF